ncbi:MAG: hypothetical protein ACI4QN_06905, partial [Candidatus Coproplasma sp.]
LWASRIAIARCAYALCFNENFINADLSNEEVREQLVKFISFGLDNTVKHFNLQKGKYDDQKVLPTTLAFIRYNANDCGITTAEVVWAGDSHCYVLTKTGLKQLTIDDEDESGAITNLFYVGGIKPTVLNYKRYEFNEPCVLMAVSDGIFDPFEPHDNFGVEKTLLEHIVQNNSYEGLMQSLSEFYDRVHGDDATMAFVPIGFATYESLKNAIKERAMFIAEKWQKFEDMNADLEVLNMSEEEARCYVETRTCDKFAVIWGMLLENYNEHSDDFVYTEEIVKILNSAKLQIADEKKKEAEKNTYEALNSLCIYMKGHIKEDFTKYFKAKVPHNVQENIVTNIDFVKKLQTNLLIDLNKQEKSFKINNERERWLKVIKEREEYYWQEFNSSSDIDQREKYLRWFSIWGRIELQFLKGNHLYQEMNNLEPSEKREAKAINVFINTYIDVLKTPYSEIEKSVKIAQDKYNNSIDRLFDILLKAPSLCNKIFSEEIMTKYSLLRNEEQNIQLNNEKFDISRLLGSQKETLIKAIVNTLTEHYDSTSMIDDCFNATRLNAFRRYYKLKKLGNIDVKEFEKQLEAIDAEYKSLIAM